jgi:menaquinone-specific isochorismate synthase
VLRQFCTSVDEPSEPEVLWLRQVAHLATPLSGELDGEEPDWPGVLELLAALHPTPAVGGFPTQAALDLIAKLEPDGRSLYAGPVGWVDSRGNGEFVIGIRSAEVNGSSAVLHAGAGVVSGSDPAKELAEIALKAETMLGALTTG